MQIARKHIPPAQPLTFPSVPRRTCAFIYIYFIAEEKKNGTCAAAPHKNAPRGRPAARHRTLVYFSQTELIRKVTRKIAPITQVATETCFILPVHTLTNM